MIRRAEAKLVRLMVSLGGDKCGIPITDPYSSEGQFVARKMNVKRITILKMAGNLKRQGVLQRTMKYHWKVIQPHAEMSERGPGNYRSGKKIDPAVAQALYAQGMSLAGIGRELKINWQRAKALVFPEYEKQWRASYRAWRKRQCVQYQILRELGR